VLRSTEFCPLSRSAFKCWTRTANWGGTAEADDVAAVLTLKEEEGVGLGVAAAERVGPTGTVAVGTDDGPGAASRAATFDGVNGFVIDVAGGAETANWGGTAEADDVVAVLNLKEKGVGLGVAAAEGVGPTGTVAVGTDDGPGPASRAVTLDGVNGFVIGIEGGAEPGLGVCWPWARGASKTEGCFGTTGGAALLLVDNAARRVSREGAAVAGLDVATLATGTKGVLSGDRGGGGKNDGYVDLRGVGCFTSGAVVGICRVRS
jgi:hypothetical protein